MDLGLLARQPDQRDDREAAVPLGVQHVLPVAVGVALALFGGEQIRGAEHGSEQLADQMGRWLRG